MKRKFIITLCTFLFAITLSAQENIFENDAMPVRKVYRVEQVGFHAVGSARILRGGEAVTEEVVAFIDRGEGVVELPLARVGGSVLLQLLFELGFELLIGGYV